MSVPVSAERSMAPDLDQPSHVNAAPPRSSEECDQKRFGLGKALGSLSLLFLFYVLSAAPALRLATTSRFLDEAIGRPRVVGIWEFAYAPVRRLLETAAQPPLLSWARVWRVEPAFRAYTRRAMISNNLRRIGLALHAYSAAPASPLATAPIPEASVPPTPTPIAPSAIDPFSTTRRPPDEPQGRP